MHTAAAAAPWDIGVGVAAIEARSLYRFFRAGDEETQALRGVSLTVAGGELVVVAGPSGSGKSTLLACLAGLDDPDGGLVLVEGQRISHQPESVRARLRAHRIGVLAQSGNLFEHLTVAANLEFVRPPNRVRDAQPASHNAGDALTAVGLADRVDAYPSELSGGELARAGLAVALAGAPPVLLADEPTGELDSTTEAQVLDLLVQTAHAGVAVIVASHSPVVAAAADRLVALQDGRVVG